MAVSNGLAVTAMIFAVAVGADTYVHLQDMRQAIATISTKADDIDALARQASAAATQAAARVDQAGAFAAQAAARADQAGAVAAQATAKSELVGGVAARAEARANQASGVADQAAVRADQAGVIAAQARDAADRLAGRVVTSAAPAALPIVIRPERADKDPGRFGWVPHSQSALNIDPLSGTRN